MVAPNSPSPPTETDVLVIGSGPSGAVVAKRLFDAGVDVTVLEQGEWTDYDRARADTPEFELTARREWSSDPTQRHGKGDFPIDNTDSEVVPLMWNGVGGSSTSWAANWMRSKPSDFRVRTLDGVADDWPISYFDLEPHFRKVEPDFAVSGVEGDPAYPEGYAPPLPPVTLTPGGRRMAEAHNRIGWHWWPGSNAISTVSRGELNPCQQRTACMWGCVEGAKVSVDLTHWRPLVAQGLTLVSGARVTQIQTNAQGHATGAVFTDSAGVERSIAARTVVVAANAVGTPRLLLASGRDGSSNGLANSSGLVGRRLMLHPTAGVVGLFDEDLQSYRGPWGQMAYTLQFYETDDSRDFVRGAKWSLQPTGGPLQSTKRWPWGDSQFWGKGFHAELARRFGRSLSWGIICEDLPDESNRVVLDGDNPDETGMPGVRIEYSTSENSKRMLRFMTARAVESFEAASATRTVVAPQVRETGWHMLGTAKMGEDPGTSVVNRYGRAHDVPNLYVVDGSVWPTSSGMNPTATIAAFASWAADHMLEDQRLKEVPA